MPQLSFSSRINQAQVRLNVSRESTSQFVSARICTNVTIAAADMANEAHTNYTATQMEFATKLLFKDNILATRIALFVHGRETATHGVFRDRARQHELK